MSSTREKNSLKAFDKGLTEEGKTPVATICVSASTAASLMVTKGFHNATFVCIAWNITSSKWLFFKQLDLFLHALYINYAEAEEARGILFRARVSSSFVSAPVSTSSASSALSTVPQSHAYSRMNCLTRTPFGSTFPSLLSFCHDSLWISRHERWIMSSRKLFLLLSFQTHSFMNLCVCDGIKTRWACNL